MDLPNGGIYGYIYIYCPSNIGTNVFVCNVYGDLELFFFYGREKKKKKKVLCLFIFENQRVQQSV